MRIQIRSLFTRGAAKRTAGQMGAVLLAAGLLFNIPREVRAGKTTTTTENVTTIVHDLDTGGAPLLLKSDDYNDPGLYEATYSVADPNLSSSIFEGGWFLRMYSQSTRTLYITPNDAINTSQPIGPPLGLYWQDVEVAAKCYDQNLNQVPFQNIVTSSGNCLMIVDFYYGGTKYKLAMGPSLSQTLQGLPNMSPATGLVMVTCNFVSNGQCVNWTMTPNTATGSSNPATVADLFYFGKNGKTTLQFIGQYYNTFRIDITAP